MPPDNLKKYTDSITKTVAVLSQTTDSIDSKIKDLVTILSAVNSGLITSEDKVNRALDGIGKGKFESKAAAAEYLKTLQVVDKDAEKIISKWEELKNLSTDELKRSKEYALLQVDLNDTLEELFDTKKDITEESKEQLDIGEKQINLVDDLVKKYKEFQTSVANNSGALKNINIDLTKGSNIVNDFLTKSDDILPNLFNTKAFSFDKLKSYSDDISALQQGWNTGQTEIKLPSQTMAIDVSDANDQISELIKTLKPQIEKEFQIREDNLKKYVAMQNGFDLDLHTNILKQLDTQQEVSVDKLTSINFLLNDQVSLIKDYADQINNSNQLSEVDLATLQSKIDLLSDEQKVLLGQYASSMMILDTNRDSLTITEDQLKLYKAISLKLEQHRGQFDQIADSVQSMFDIVPYGMQRMLGIDKISHKIMESIDKGLKTYTGALASGQTKLEASTQAAKVFGNSFAEIAGSATLLVGALALIYSLVSGFEGKLENITKELGVSRKVANDILNTSYDILNSSENRFESEEEIVAIQKNQLEQYGQILDLTTDVNKELILTAKTAEEAFGILATDAVNIMNTFKQLGADDSLSQQLLADVGYMAEAAKMSPGMIGKEILESAKELSLYFGGMPKQAAKAIIQIKRMGMSIKQAGQIADKMLNIESFMTDMTELAAMSGGEFDFSEAFDFRMNGDIEGMTKSIMDNIGSLDKFNSQSEFVQRKMAATLGMEIPDLQKSLRLKEMQLDLGEDNVTLLQSNLAATGDIADMNLENMKAKAEELNSTKELSVAFNKIKTILYKALVPIMTTLSETLSANVGIVDAIGLGFKGIGKLIGIISPIVKGFFLPFKWAGELITFIVEKLDGLFGSSEHAEDGIKTVNASLFSMSSIITGLGTTIGALFGAKYLGKITGLNTVFGKLIGQSSTAATAVTKNLTNPSIFSTIIDKFKSFSGFDILKTKAESIDLVDPLVENVEKKKGLLGKIFDKMNPFSKSTTAAQAAPEQPTSSTTPDGGSKLFDKISKMVKSGVDLIKSGFKTLKDFVIEIADTISQVLTQLGTGIGNFFNKVLGGIGEGLSKFQPQALLGAAALLVISGALWTTAKALQEFNSVNFSSLVEAGVAIGGLILAVEALGTVMSSGIGAVGLGLGIAALAAMSGTLYLFGKALNTVGDAAAKFEPILKAMFEGISNIVTSVFSGITTLVSSLASIDASNLLMVGAALSGIAIGLAALSAGSIIQGLTSLFTSDPFEKLGDIAKLANPLSIVATSIESLTNSLTQLGSVLSNINLDTLKNIKDISVGSNINLDTLKNIKDISVGSNSPATVNQQANKPIPYELAPTLPNNFGLAPTVSNSSSTETYAETNTTSKSQQINTSKIERLLTELKDAIEYYADRPSYAILQDQSISAFNNKLKAHNNK